MHRSPAAWFILLAGIYVLASLTPGCGGDDDPSAPPQDNPDPTVEVAGSVAPPAGWSGDLTSLVVIDGAGRSDVGTGGGFRLPVARDDAQLAVVVGPGGDPLFLGWLDPAHPTLNARSTAAVLAWYGLGAWMLPPGGGAYIRDALAESDVALADLESALVAQIVAHPGGFVTANPELQTALAATVDALRTGGTPAGIKGVVIDPTVQQSGIEILNEGGINKITIKNSYRRRVAGFLWRDAWEDTLGVVHEFTGDTPFLELEIDPIAGFGGTFSTIIEALTDDLAYEPVVLDPIALPYHPGARRTLYHFSALGVGQIEPLDISQYTSAELAAGEWMAFKCLIVDYFLPMLVNAAGPIVGAGSFDDAFGGEGMASQLNDYISFVCNELPNFYTEAVNGNWWGALLELWNAFLTNGTISEWTFGLVADALEALMFSADEVEDILGRAGKFFDCVGIVDVIGNFTDSIITGYQFGECRRADHWDVEVTAPVLHIEPREAMVMVYGTQLLTLVIDDDTGGVPDGSSYAYRWCNAGSHGTLVNPIDPDDTSNDFVTSSDFVQYVADRGTTGVDTVRCELMVSLGDVDTPIGEARTVLEVYRHHVVLPDTLYACPDGSAWLDPQLDPAWDDDGEVWWHWTNLSAPGRLWNQGYEDDWSSLTRQAIFEGATGGGQGYIRCIADVSYDDGLTFTAIDTATALVIVSELEMFYGETETVPRWDWVNNMCGCSIYYAFDVISGVARYQIHGYGFNDPYYYGTQISATINVNNLPPYSLYSSGHVMIQLSGGGGNCDPNNPPSEEDLCGWFESRFEGAIWEITPECEY